MKIAASLAVTLATFAITPLSAAELAPHEASFVSTLEEYYGPGDLQSWDGSMRYSISRDCQKWKSKTEVVIRFAVNGVDTEIRVVSTVYEALDGNRMEFDRRTELNGQILDRKKGGAKLQGGGGPGVATYTIPRGGTLDLPAGTVFTVASWLSSIDQYAAGKKQWTQLVFNAGELTDTSYSVRKRGVAASANPKGDAGLISRAGWLIDGKISGRHSDLDLQMTTLTHANGVTSLFMQNNNMFRTRDELVEIRALPVPQC